MGQCRTELSTCCCRRCALWCSIPAWVPACPCTQVPELLSSCSPLLLLLEPLLGCGACHLILRGASSWAANNRPAQQHTHTHVQFVNTLQMVCTQRCRAEHNHLTAPPSLPREDMGLQLMQGLAVQPGRTCVLPAWHLCKLSTKLDYQ
jgi:hypothetical protein